jgi:hypothetical protein
LVRARNGPNRDDPAENGGCRLTAEGVKPNGFHDSAPGASFPMTFAAPAEWGL